MSRPSEMWWDATRKRWRANIGGKRYTLGERKPEATRRFHELMAARHRPEPEHVPTVGELAAEYLRHLTARHRDGKLTKTTYLNARNWLGEAGLRWVTVRADRLTRSEVEAWLAEHPTWGPSTRHSVLGRLKSMVRWAIRDRKLATDPLPHLERPTPGDRRGAILRPEEMARVVAAVTPPEARQIVEFLAATGCRPGEACRIAAADVDLDAGLVTLRVHKTAGKTGRPRRIYPPPGQLDVLRQLVAKRPEGALFRNAKGRAWTPGALYEAVARAGVRCGVKAYPYMLRHRYATDGLASGESPAIVAELLGHTNLKTISGYSHLDQRAAELRAAARRVGGGESGDQ
jgi:integrase